MKKALLLLVALAAVVLVGCSAPAEKPAESTEATTAPAPSEPQGSPSLD